MVENESHAARDMDDTKAFIGAKNEFENVKEAMHSLKGWWSAD